MAGILLLTAGRKDSIKSITSLPPIVEAQTRTSQETSPKNEVSNYEKAVEIIKKYESLHSPRHWPLVGYGHKVLPGEKFSRTKALSEKEADQLLRKDLDKLCKIFRSYGKDSLLLATLAYNIGNGAVSRSSVVKKLASGNRDIKANYIAHCKYRGKEHPQIKRRRIEEFEALFEPDTIEV
ncbi:MAG: glycoside hydrolase family protein [Muribaculaceae bacterium]|nr:glycoside hydrolase family protein [Muribaculaceae bacterium]